MLAGLSSLSCAQTLSTPQINTPLDQHAAKVLNAALEATGGFVDISPIEDAKNQVDLSTAVRSGAIDVAWLPANKALEKGFNAIPIPVFAGLTGYFSLTLKNNGNQAPQSGHLNLSDLQGKTIAVAQQSPVIPHLQKAGAQIVEAETPEQLPVLLQTPEVAGIVQPLLSQPAAADTASNHKEVMLLLPDAHYFVVQRSQQQLLRALHLGLHKLQQSGEYAQLLMQSETTRNALQKLEGESQRIVLAEAPLLADTAPMHQGFWYEQQGAMVSSR